MVQMFQGRATTTVRIPDHLALFNSLCYRVGPVSSARSRACVLGWICTTTQVLHDLSRQAGEELDALLQFERCDNIALCLSLFCSLCTGVPEGFIVRSRKTPLTSALRRVIRLDRMRTHQEQLLRASCALICACQYTIH